MLSRLVLVTALLAGLALLIQAPAQASERDGYHRHDRYVEVRRAPAYYYEPRPVYRDHHHYRPAPVYRHERRHHARRHDHHRRYYQQHRHHHGYYYSDRRW